MQQTSEYSALVAATHQPWEDANLHAISLGADGRWADAVDAFDEALRLAPRFVESPETHAVLRSNLAQALFHSGDTMSAIESARRSLAARLVCCDSEHDAPMVRARADLAVYLAASGAVDEARAMLDSAMTAIETTFGDEDLRLCSLLENQARLALLSAQPATAEPALLRLHALLENAGEDVSQLDRLFALVAQARREVSATPPDIVIFPAAAEQALELIDDEPHGPMRSPNAQSILSEGLVEPGSHTTPALNTQTNPLGFEVQYGVPVEMLSDSQHPLARPENALAAGPTPPPLDNPFW